MPTPEEMQQQIEDLQAKLNAEAADTKKQRQAKQELQSQLDALTAERDDLAKAKAEADAEAERVKLESEGKYAEALEAARAKHAAELADREKQVGQMSGVLEAEFGTNRLMAALGRAGVAPERMAQAAQLLGSRVKVSLKDGQPVTEVFDDTGQPMQVDGSSATVDQLVAAWLPGNQHFLPPSGDSGSGSHAGGATGNVTLADLDANPNKKLEFIRKNGQQAYLKLAAKARQEAAATE